MLFLIICLLMLSNVLCQSVPFEALNHEHCELLWNNGVCNKECDQEYENRTIAGFGNNTMEVLGDCLLYPIEDLAHKPKEHRREGISAWVIILPLMFIMVVGAAIAQYKYKFAQKVWSFRTIIRNKVGMLGETQPAHLESGEPRYISFRERVFQGQFDYSRIDEQVY